MTDFKPALQVVTQEILEAPYPLDAKIAEGVVLRGLFCGVQQRMVTERLHDTFSAMRSDMDKEYGNCIAVTVGKLALETEDEIDDLVIRVANQQNHGLRPLPVEALTQSIGADLVWSGYDPHIKKLLKIYKRSTPIVMSDNMPHNGTLWALKAKANVSIID